MRRPVVTMPAVLVTPDAPRYTWPDEPPTRPGCSVTEALRRTRIEAANEAAFGRVGG